MKRKVNVFLSVVLLLVIAISALYFIGVNFTGFAVFNQQDQAAFDLGFYNNTEYNGSAVILSSGQTSGTYTSEIFNATETSNWNSLTWVGNKPLISSSILMNPTYVEDESAGDITSKVNLLDGTDTWERVEVQSWNNTLSLDATINSVVGYCDVKWIDSGAQIGFQVSRNNGTTWDSEVCIQNTTQDTRFGCDLRGNSGVDTTDEVNNLQLRCTFPTGNQNKYYSTDWVHVISNYTMPTNISFQVRACSAADCSDASFSEADLSSLNLVGDYFQYKADFTSSESAVSPTLENVIIDYNALSYISLSISQPSGTKSSELEIPLQFSTSGNNLTCWYSVETSGSILIGNTTILNCVDTSFSVSGDGSYTLNLYANNSFGGYAHKTSSFVVDTSSVSSTPTSENEPVEEETDSFITEAVIQKVTKTTKLNLSTIDDFVINPNSSKQIKLSAENAGDNPLSACKLSVVGDSAIWFSYSNETVIFNPGEQKDLFFDLDVPAETPEAEYPTSILLECSELTDKVDFNIDVVKKKLDLELLSVDMLRGSRVRVIYSLEELSSSDQNVTLKFTLISGSQTTSELEETKRIEADETREFRTIIPVNESLILVRINETTNETLESELELLINLNSEIYSLSIQETVRLGVPIMGFAIFGGGGLTGNIGVLIFTLVALIAAFFVIKGARMHLRNKYKNKPSKEISD